VQEWVNIYNGSGNGLDCVHSIAIDKWGDVYVTGESLGSGTNFDYATIKYTNEGIEQWIARYNRAETSLEQAFDMAVDDSGNVFVTGNGITGVKYAFLTIKYSQLTTGILDDVNPIPNQFILEQNYPNPFNPSTKIKFTIPQDERRETKNVSLKVFDVLGNEVATLVDEYKPAGSYDVEFDASRLSSGVYFYQLKAGEYIQTKKMMFLK
jgi:hypothetical protein